MQSVVSLCHGEEGYVQIWGRICLVVWRYEIGRVGGVATFLRILKSQFPQVEGFFGGYRLVNEMEEYMVMMRFGQYLRGTRFDLSSFSLGMDKYGVISGATEGVVSDEGVSSVTVLDRIVGGRKVDIYRRWMSDIVVGYLQVGWDCWPGVQIGSDGRASLERYGKKMRDGANSDKGRQSRRNMKVMSVDELLCSGS